MIPGQMQLSMSLYLRCSWSAAVREFSLYQAGLQPGFLAGWTQSGAATLAGEQAAPDCA